LVILPKVCGHHKRPHAGQDKFTTGVVDRGIANVNVRARSPAGLAIVDLLGA
jgi:hypothetical protein